ncbi:hypothetical protein [Metabacillus fastidiosus]|uniref:hypothetical protein n=1 Tax=Metabacillus fastidiosus TaxID=1458 RepID=UPI00082463D8|nr:hypothetical protein [Metabacillus fastidiosus]MED4453006.1 hypothetical protein [Metabacillus fastidiosus]MED4463060.1 hypothetical protein [Metabacillus fastidiosus]
MNKKTKVIGAAIALGIIIMLYVSPVLTIRSYILLQGYPIVSITAHIDYNGKLNNGEMAYQVETWIDRETKMPIPYIYLKKNIIGMYYVAEVKVP